MTEIPGIGERATIEHAFAAADVAAFARLSGDDNPIHVDAAAARAAGFEREVVHGVLVTGLLSRLLGSELPGPGTILLGQDLRFRRPVYVGEPVRASVEVTAVRQDKPVITLRSWVEIAATGEAAVDGTTTVLLRPTTDRGRTEG
jgi:enoyl-CoA hydratase